MFKGFGETEYIRNNVPRNLVFIDSMARVHPNCKIGAGTKVWQFATVIRYAVIGMKCSIGSCAIVDGAEIGNHCLVQHGAQLHPGLKASYGVFFGPGSIMCNDRFPSVDKEGFDQDNIGQGLGSVFVGPLASIGAGAIILPGSIIGAGALVAAGAVVSGNVKPGYLLKRSGEQVLIDAERMHRVVHASSGDVLLDQE